MPSKKDLIEKLGGTYPQWIQIQAFVIEKYPDGLKQWNHSAKKYGWNYRIKDKKRTILYFLPRDSFFRVAFVFGQKATNQILQSNSIPKEIKTELEQATKYAEGRGIRIEVKNDSLITAIKKLIEIKLAN